MIPAVVQSLGRADENFSKYRPIAQRGEGALGFDQGKNLMNGRTQFAQGRPFQSGAQIGAIAPVASDQAMLFHKEWPEIEMDIPAGGRAASDDGAAPHQSMKGLLQKSATDMLDDEIDTTFARDSANFFGPGI